MLEKAVHTIVLPPSTASSLQMLHEIFPTLARTEGQKTGKAVENFDWTAVGFADPDLIKGSFDTTTTTTTSLRRKALRPNPPHKK
jgi:hypothetical protein